MPVASLDAMNWFALNVKPRHEKAVETLLRAKTFDVYSPFYMSRRVWSDRVKEVHLPLFPRYVFCRFGFQNRRAVLQTPSVLSIVGFGGSPYPVSEAEISRLKAITDSGLRVMPWSCLKLGERVRINRGLLTGVEGILVRKKTECRVVVNVELLQRAVAVEVDSAVIERTGPRNLAVADPGEECNVRSALECAETES